MVCGVCTHVLLTEARERSQVSWYVGLLETGCFSEPGAGLAGSESQRSSCRLPHTVGLIGVCDFVWLLTWVLRIYTQILVLA